MKKIRSKTDVITNSSTEVFVIKGCPDPVKAMKESGNKFLEFLADSLVKFDQAKYQEYLDRDDDYTGTDRWGLLLCLPDINRKAEYYSYYAEWLCTPISMTPVQVIPEVPDFLDYPEIPEENLPKVVLEWRKFIIDVMTKKIDSFPEEPKFYPYTHIARYFGKYSTLSPDLSDGDRLSQISWIMDEVCEIPGVTDWIDSHIKELPDIRDLFKIRGFEFTIQDMQDAWFGSFDDDSYYPGDIDESYGILDKLGNCDCKYMFRRTS